MKHLALLLVSVWTSQAALPPEVLNALHVTESSGKRVNVRAGDGGRAIGPFQIHKAYWRDAVRHDPSIGGRYQDCHSYTYSVKVVEAYLDKWARDHWKAGRWEAVARIHNGGPEGWRKSATTPYAIRFRSNLLLQISANRRR